MNQKIYYLCLTYQKGNKIKFQCYKTANKILKTCGKHVENDNYLFAALITNRNVNDFNKIEQKTTKKIFFYKIVFHNVVNIQSL